MHRHDAATGDISALPRAALEICVDVIAGPRPAVADLPSRGTVITTPWLHHDIHGEIPGLPVHAIVTYFGTPTRRSWRHEGRRLAGAGRPGTIGVIPIGWDGDWDIEGGSSLSYVFLGDDRLQAFAQAHGARQPVELVPRLAEEDPVGADLLRILSHEAARHDPADRLFLEHALDLLCLHVMRAHAAVPMRPVAPARGLARWQVRRVTAWMREHLDEPVGLAELAALTFLSRSHFCTAFRQATGCTPHGWLTRLRMERARELLRDPALPITGVALAVGYQTPSAFTAAFRRHVGATPSAYRRAL